MPAVSVIVPNYNHAPYLRQRLDSIFNQTYQDFEVIILDDCSTDNSKEIIEEYRNRSQVSHIVYNETNSGSPFKQWAKGFDLAKGEYIWIAESDDWAELTFLEELVPHLNDKGTYIAFSNSNIVSPERMETDIKDVKQDCIYDGIQFVKTKMWRINYILNASAVLFKKEALKLITKKYQSFISSGDWLFWIEMCELGSVYYSHKELNFNNRHGNNTTAMWGKNMSSGKTFFEDRIIFHYLRKKGYIPFFHSQVTIINKLDFIDNERSHFISNDVYISVRNDWKKEIFSEKSSRCFIKVVVAIYKIKNKLFNHR